MAEEYQIFFRTLLVRNRDERTNKMKFPTFTGQNPNSWLRMAHEFFEYYGIPVWDRFPIVAYHVKGEAAIWFRDLERFAMLWSWESFVRHLKCQFRKEIQEEEAADQELANRIAEMRAQREERFRQMKAKFQEIQEFPILKRLEFPRFIGEDPEEWRCRAEEFFACYRTPDEHRVPLSTLYLGGKIREMEWFQDIRWSKRVTTWDEFVRILHTRYSVPKKVEEHDNFKNEDEEKKDDAATQTITPESVPDPIEDTKQIITPEPDPVEATQHKIIPAENVKDEEEQPRDQIFSEISESEPDHGASNPVPEKFEDLDTFKTGEDAKRHEERSEFQIGWICINLSRLLDERSDQNTSTQTLRAFVSPYLTGVTVVVALLKHRWRWKCVEEEANAAAEADPPTCPCRRSRAEKNTGGPWKNLEA
jgi:hypothetical protein